MASRTLVPHVPGMTGHGAYQQAAVNPRGLANNCAASAQRSPGVSSAAPRPAAPQAAPKKSPSKPDGKPVDPLHEDDPYKWDFLRELCQEEFGLEIADQPVAPSLPAYTYAPPAPEPTPSRTEYLPPQPAATRAAPSSPDPAVRQPLRREAPPAMSTPSACTYTPPTPEPAQRIEYASPQASALPSPAAPSSEPLSVRQTIKRETVRRSTVDLSGLMHAKERYLGQQASDSRASSASTSTATSPLPTRPISAYSSPHSSGDSACPAGTPPQSSGPLHRGTYGFMPGSSPHAHSERVRASSLVPSAPPPARTPEQERREEQLITTYIPSSLPQQSAPPQAPPQYVRAVSNPLDGGRQTPPRPVARPAADSGEHSKTANLRNVFETVAAQRRAAQESLQRKSLTPKIPSPQSSSRNLLKMPLDLSSGSEASASARSNSPVSACSWSHDAHKSAANTAPSSPDLRARYPVPHPIEKLQEGYVSRYAEFGQPAPAQEWGAHGNVYEQQRFHRVSL